MIQNDAAILQHFVEEWEREIVLYVEKYKDKMAARNVLPVRNVGEDVGIDVIQKYDRSGPGASVVAKGSVPDTMGLTTSSDKHELFQIATSFNLNAKDLKMGPKTKSVLVDIALRDLHRAEDDFAFNGNSKLNVNGIKQAARANSNGKITTSTNKGAWSGETGTDIYDDINTAIGKMDGDFDPAYLLGNRTDLLYLNRPDSERQPYYKTVAGLFGMTNENDKSWIYMTSHITAGHVYVIPKDFLAGELVVAENPHIVEYPMMPGQNYRFEVIAWVVPEMHQNDAFVEIATG
jgi:uncharacterized linocin/CFP29 family protein